MMLLGLKPFWKLVGSCFRAGSQLTQVNPYLHLGSIPILDPKRALISTVPSLAVQFNEHSSRQRCGCAVGWRAVRF